MPRPHRSRDAQQAADQALIDGLTKHASQVQTILIGGTTLPVADILVMLQARIEGRKAPLASLATWLADVNADRALRARTDPLVSSIRRALHVAFAGSMVVLGDFGLAPPRTHVATPEERMAAAVKARATRAARHTMGPKQRAKIKGAAPPAAPADSS